MQSYAQRYVWSDWRPDNASSAANSEISETTSDSLPDLITQHNTRQPELPTTSPETPQSSASQSAGRFRSQSVSAKARSSASASASSSSQSLPSQSVNTRWAHPDVFYRTAPNEPFPRPNTPFRATNAPAFTTSPSGAVRPRPSLPSSVAPVLPRPAFPQRAPLPSVPVFRPTAFPSVRPSPPAASAESVNRYSGHDPAG